MNHAESAYGLWWLVIINSAIFIMFAFSFFKPATARDWRTFGAFSAFIIALFVEMYGFPLTIYLLSGWLQTRFPELAFLNLICCRITQVTYGQRYWVKRVIHILAFCTSRVIFFWAMVSIYYQKHGTCCTTRNVSIL